jgi:hypothetical protein
MDRFCNQNADQLGSLAGLSLLTVYVGVVECAPASLPPASSSLTHARRMDGFCNQNADQLGSLAGLSLLTVYVGVVECAPASPYTYSSPRTRSPSSRHPPFTLYPFPPRSLVCGGQTSPHKPRLVVSHSTCPSIYILLPPRAQLCIRYCRNKHTHSHLCIRYCSNKHTQTLLFQ